MNYEKKYKEALEKARLVLQEKGNEPDGASILSKLFPELIESEDERIRKHLISFFDNLITFGNASICETEDIKVDNILAWLEKQGEQKVIIPQFRVGETIKYKECIYPYQTIEEIGNYGYKLRDCYTNTSSTVPFDKENEFELVEQKPADKIEPKFKVGDWVVTSYGKVNQVVSVDKDENGFTLDDDTYFSGSWKDNYHLWTIQDAKDGDVLAVENMIFIYKTVLASHVVSYCKLFNNKFELFNDARTCCEGNSKIHPATKEQHDLLFQKMKEAGYEWDSEKKELKKIEQSTIEEVNGEDYGIDSLYHAQRILEKTLGSVDGYQSDDGILEHKCAISAVKKLYEQKYAWSEEDDRKLQLLIAMCDETKGDSATYSTMYREMEELKSWLKSLKDRYTWEPSEEQLKSLKSVIDVGYFTSYPNSLETLYEQLKKLK